MFCVCVANSIGHFAIAVYILPLLLPIASYFLGQGLCTGTMYMYNNCLL